MFVVLCWTLWITHNKLVIESKVPNHPADIMFKMALFLQVWINLAKPQNSEKLLLVARGLREIYFSLAPPRPAFAS